MPHNWIDSEPCGPEHQLTQAQVEQWRSAGFTLVSGLFPASLIMQLTEAAKQKYPAADSADAIKFTDFGRAGQLSFPSKVDPLNQITLHETLLTAVGDLLDERIEDLRLTQSDLWPKYGREEKSGLQDNSDQRIHVDYPNHSLAHPALA